MKFAVAPLTLASVALATTSRVAAASPPEKTHDHWYGEQVIVTSLVGHSIAGAGLANAIGGGPDGLTLPLVAMGGATYLLGGPIVHLTHKRAGAAFASLGINVVTPLALGTLGALAICSSGCRGDGGGIGAAIGFGVGAVVGTIAATALDAGFLSYESATRRSDPPAKVKSARVRVTPTLSAGPSQMVIGAAGIF